MSEQSVPTTANQNLSAPNANDNLVPGTPTTPALARSVVTGTSVDKANQNREHMCDFSLDIIKDNQLSAFLKAQAKNIRDAIRAVMRLLGFSDATGQFQWLKDALLSITRELNYIKKNIIQPIVDFETIALGYVKKINDIIVYILSLPAKAAALLKDCLTHLYASVASVFNDGVTGSNSTTGTFGDVIAAAKQTTAALSQTMGAAVQAASGAVVIAAAASAVPQVVNNIKKGV